MHFFSWISFFNLKAYDLFIPLIFNKHSKTCFKKTTFNETPSQSDRCTRLLPAPTRLLCVLLQWRAIPYQNIHTYTHTHAHAHTTPVQALMAALAAQSSPLGCSSAVQWKEQYIGLLPLTLGSQCLPHDVALSATQAKIWTNRLTVSRIILLCKQNTWVTFVLTCVFYFLLAFVCACLKCMSVFLQLNEDMCDHCVCALSHLLTDLFGPSLVLEITTYDQIWIFLMAF